MPVADFDWRAWDQGEKPDATPIATVQEIFAGTGG